MIIHYLCFIYLMIVIMYLNNIMLIYKINWIPNRENMRIEIVNYHFSFTSQIKLIMRKQNVDIVEASRHFKHFMRLSVIITDETRLKLDPIFNQSRLGDNNIFSSLRTLVISLRIGNAWKDKIWRWIRVTSLTSFATVESIDSALLYYLHRKIWAVKLLLCHSNTLSEKKPEIICIPKYVTRFQDIWLLSQ